MVLRICTLRSKVEDKISKVKIEFEILKVWVENDEIDLKVEEDQFIECQIQSINKMYKERYSKYLYYCWIVQHVASQVRQNARKIQIYIFQCVPINYSLIFIPIACRTTPSEDLKWEKFANFFELIL